MTRQELLDAIAAMEYVDYVNPTLEEVELGKPGNCNRYKVHYREVDPIENTSLYVATNIYVINENTDSEAAFYENDVPTVRLPSVKRREAEA